MTVTPIRRTVDHQAQQDEIVISRCPWPYSQEFKMNAIRMVREQNKSIHAVAYELDITKGTLTRWLSRYDAAKARNARIAARNKPSKTAKDLPHRSDADIANILKLKEELKKEIESVGVDAFFRAMELVVKKREEEVYALKRSTASLKAALLKTRSLKQAA